MSFKGEAHKSHLETDRIILKKAQSTRSLQQYRRDHPSRRMGSVARQSSKTDTWNEDDPYQEFKLFSKQKLCIRKINVQKQRVEVVRPGNRKSQVWLVNGGLYFVKIFKYKNLNQINRILYNSNRIQEVLPPSCLQIYFYQLYSQELNWQLALYMDFLPRTLNMYLATLVPGHDLPKRAALIANIAKAILQLHVKKQFHGNFKKSKILVGDGCKIRLNCAVQRPRRKISNQENRSKNSKKRVTPFQRDIDSFLCIAYEIMTGVELQLQQLAKKRWQGRRLFTKLQRGHRSGVVQCLQNVMSREMDLGTMVVQLGGQSCI